MQKEVEGMHHMSGRKVIYTLKLHYLMLWPQGEVHEPENQKNYLKEAKKPHKKLSW